MTSTDFLLPAGLLVEGQTLAERAAAWAARVRASEGTVAAIQAEIDDLAFRLYGLDGADRAALTFAIATEATDDAVAEASEGEDDDEEQETATADASALAADLLAYAPGCVFGRWDIRYAIGELPAPPSPDPFAPLPVCPPGMLQNAAGLPAAPDDLSAGYPIRVVWPGVLVDDESHQEDIARGVRDVLAALFPERADAIAAEACGMLGVQTLRDWFRRPTGFFADHLKRHSKSRRQAPIYWPLSTVSGSYTLWLYYHRLNDQTLYKCIQLFIDPKLADVEKERAHLRAVVESGEGNTKSRRQLAEAEQLRTELKEMRVELEHWASRWTPNLNDGVLITAAPLWKLFRLSKWQKDLKACWQALEKGDYDWAHLALAFWPERVREKCKTDRSLAIAHGLEDLCQVVTSSKRTKKRSNMSSSERVI